MAILKVFFPTLFQEVPQVFKINYIIDNAAFNDFPAPFNAFQVFNGKLLLKPKTMAFIPKILSY